MSLQRILESARRLRTPVILSDLAGRDPLVILPLDQFEALSSLDHPAASPRQDVASVMLAPEPVAEGLQIEFTAEQSQKIPQSAETMDMGENPEISLDERFYLEPVAEE